MNLDKNLILINGEDKTRSISYCKYNKGKYDITFNNSDKIYPYNYNSLKWISNPKEVDIKNKVLYCGEVPLLKVSKVLLFDMYYRVFFDKGFNKVYPTRDISIEEATVNNPISNNCFEYLKELSNYLGLKVDGENILAKQYKKLKIINKNSILAYYLYPKSLKSKTINETVIFPFGFNLSQKEATEKALLEQISIIEGPPGTGKTQTILNIIANVILGGGTIAVVSNNNSAIENISEKLNKNGFGFIQATLGKRENKENFINNQEDNYPSMNNWELKQENLISLEEELTKSQDTLNRMLKKQNELAILKQELSCITLEEEHFKLEYYQNRNDNVVLKSIYKLNENNIMNLLIELSIENKIYDKISFSKKIINFFKYGIYSSSFYKNTLDSKIDYLYSLYYELKIKSLNERISELEKELSRYNFNGEMKKYSFNSLKLFKSKLAKEYSTRTKRPLFKEEDLWKNFNSVVKEYPVILSTTHSLRNCTPENFLYDYIIIDEASQVDILTGALALSCGKNVIVVGDLKQLPHIVTKDDKEIINSIRNRYNLGEAYNYSENSLLKSISKLNDGIAKTLLKEHYRCHPKIIAFCNSKFYNDELIIMTNEEEGDKPLTLYKTKEGNHARGTLNQRQIDVINQEVIPNLEKNKSIGIITPYRLQADEIAKITSENIEVDTVHKYQGREKEVIILSTVTNEVNDFVDDPNLVNVAISRAIENLIVVTSDFNNSKGESNLGDLIKYIQYNNFEVINSSVSSVFDLLYKQYSKKLVAYLEKTKKISEFASENLMYKLITDVIKLEEFNYLGVVIHTPIKMIIKDISKLTNEEKKFTLNPLTHTDFLIYNKVDKTPILVVEVDGYKYHVQNEKQLARDKMKDDIFNKYNIPIVRFKTNGSGEEEKLKTILNKIIKN